MSFCPNKNTPEFKQMSAALGDVAATACWYENQGHPIWETNTGEPSPLWNELIQTQDVSNGATAMQIKQHMYTKSFKASQAGYQLNIYGEPTLADLLAFVDFKRGVADTKALYQRFKLVDKNDPNKPIKWSITDANYKKIVGIAQNINGGSVASARVSKVASQGKEYYTIILTPKAAFTNTEGQKVAFYDSTSGEITFTDKGLTAETVIHEFSHPFVDALATHNKELFDNLINSINADKNVPEIQKIIEHVNTHYAEASEEIRNKELLAYTISEYGKGNIDPETGTNTRVAIKRFYKWLTGLVKDLMDQMRSRKTLYVDQIHPNTKYNEIADLFTVYSEIGDINLGVSPSGMSKKIAPEEITDPKEAKRAVLKAKMVARKKDNKGGSTEANKLINVASAEFVDIKDEAAHMSSLLPKEIATELTPDYIKVLSGGKAVIGMFKDGVIHLTEQGPKGTAYHEGFHAVFRTLLSGSEQNRVLSESQTIFAAPTSKDILDLELQLGITSDEAFKIYYEEQLADAFAEYMEDPVRASYPEGIRGFFKRVADWITRVFFNKGHVDKLFSGISTGKYTKLIPNITRSVAYKVHPIFDVYEVNRITRELISVAFKDIQTIEDLRIKPVNLTEVENHVVDLAIEAEEAGNEELMDNLSFLFDEESGNLDTFWLSEMDAYLRNVIGLSPKKNKKEVKETKEDQDEENAEDLERNNFLKSSYEVSGKTNASAAIKFMVAMTPQVRVINTDKPAELDNIEKVASNLTGLPVLVDFAIIYNDLENMLAGITSVNIDNQPQDALELMLSAMKAQAKYKPEMLYLADKLDSASEELRTQFFGAFSKQKGSFVHHQVTGSIKEGRVTSLFSTSNFNTKSSVLFNSWATNFSREMGQVVNKERVYNPEKIAEFLIARDAFMPVLEKAMVEAEDNDVMIPKSVINQFEGLLGKLGIKVSPHTIQYLVESSIKEGYDLPYAAEYAQKLNVLFYDFVRATNDLKTRSGSIYGKHNHIQDNARFFKNILAEADGYFRQVPGENSFIGPEGNQIYSFQHNDSTSKAVQRFKQGDLTHLQNVATSAYGKNSVWAAELLHGVNGKNSRDAFELHMYGNLRSEETAGDRGAKASELKTSETYMDVVNKTLDGFYIGLAEADKARQTYVKGPKFRRIGFQLSRNAEDDKVSYKILNKNGLTILKGYLADELSRMRTATDVVYGTTKSEPVPEKDWVLYYHYYPVAPGKGTIGEKLDKIPGNAFNSYLFPSIDLVKFGLQTTEGDLLIPNAANFDNNTELDKYIITHFGNLVRTEMNYALEQGLLQKDKTGNIINGLVSMEHVQKYTREGVVYMEELMGDYVLNSIIGNVEFTKLFNGDPAIYKVKGVGKSAWSLLDHFGDFKKRIPAIFASGQDFRVFKAKDGTPIVRPHYMSATIENISTPSAFFGEKNDAGEVVFNEANLKMLSDKINISVDELKKLFKPYLDINQTDAQAWITLDAYKERMNGLGKWTPEHEDAFEKATANKALNPVELKLLAQPLKTVHAELVMTKNKEMIMNYNKQSEAVLLPFMKNLEIGKLLTAMERDGIDHVIVLDGKKAGAQGLVDVTDGNGNILDAKDIKMNPIALSYNNLFLQQDLPSKGVKDTLVGSQGTKNVLSVVNLEATYFYSKTGRQLIDLFHETIGRLSDNGLIDLDKSLGYKAEDDTYALDEQGRSKIHKIVQREFEGEISENHHNALNENISFDALPIKNKIMNKLLALTTKKTVKLKQPGGAMIQLSDFGFIGTSTVITDKVKDGIIWFKDPTERLKPMHATEEGIKPAQILMPFTKLMDILATNKKFKASILEKYGTEDYSELTHKQLQSLISKDVLEGLSYRIPNQGPSSNDAFEIVGILPATMGDTMVAFSDITMKTGSDFDIDKAFIILPNFYYDETAGKIKKATYDISDLSKLRPKELQNLRLDLMRQMLLHPDAYAAVMAPLDDPWLENYAKELFPEQTKLRPMEFFTGRYQAEIKSIFDGAKSLVGSIANHMTHHSLSQADGLYFNDYYLGKGVTTASTITSTTESTGSDKLATGFTPANAQQEQVISDVFDYLKNYDETGAGYHVISGKAGTGKTTVVAEIIAQLPARYRNIQVAAISNKATRNLGDKVSHISGVTAASVASTLGLKMNIETEEFTKDKDDLSVPPGAYADLLIIDEASMINEEALEYLLDLQKPIIFLGDIGQLPPIRKEGDSNIGKDSPVFDKVNSQLFERVRQGEESPILPFADYYWNNSRVSNPVLNPTKDRESKVTNKGSIVFGDKAIIKQTLGLYKKAIEDNNINLIKTVVYKNDTRNKVNEFIRVNILEDASIPYQKGELLMFNGPYSTTNFDYENSDEVQIQKSEIKTDDNGLEYHEILLTDSHTIKVISNKDKAKFDKLVATLFAEAKSSSGKERKQKFAKAWAFKNMYANIDYSYAITSHKSQGSTYNTVVVYESDIMSVAPTSAKEKSQAMYTAITRASETALIIDGSDTDEALVTQALENSKNAADKMIKPTKSANIIRGAATMPSAIIKLQTSLSNINDEDGNPINSTLGGYMNAIVDAAKDPFIARANVNLYTANTVFMLARAGVSRKWIVAFSGQPILRDIVAAQDQLEGRFAKPIWKDGRRLSAVESVLEKYGLSGITEQEFRGNNDKYFTLRESMSGTIKVTTDMLEKAINSDNKDSDTYKNNQLKVLKQFLEWQSKAAELNDVIKVSKADVEGATKTIMSAKLAVNLANKVLDSNSIGNANKMLGIYRNSEGEFNIPAEGDKTRMIGRYFNNSVLAAVNRFSRFFISGSKAAQSAVESIAKHAGYDELITGVNMEKVATDISNEVYSQAATDTRVFNIESERLHALLYGTGAMKYGADAELGIAARVEAAKHTELASNLLINGLQFQAGRNGAPDKVYLPNTETIKDTKEALSQAWNEILQVDKQLGEDLILYAFFTTGFSAGVGSFAEHIPNEWLKAHGFHDDIASKNLEYNAIPTLSVEQMDKIYKNSYKNNQLVPVVDEKSMKSMQWSAGGGLVIDRDYGFLLTQNDSLNYTIGTGPHGKIFKRFVKRTEATFDQDGKAIGKTYKLYKLAGYTNNNDAVYLRTNMLGIAGYGNNVKEYIGDGKTSIFPQNNVSLPQGLAELSEMLNQRGAVVDATYEEIHMPVLHDSSNPEERLQFCIMK